MEEQDTRRIVVVGGGTAGWLTALIIQKHLEKTGSADARVKITLIESPNIPTVGVGEGSTSIFRQVLLDLGIDEDEFLRETGATFKFGIKHEGWRKDGAAYFGPIDDPHLLVPTPKTIEANWLHFSCIASSKPVESAHLYFWLMRDMKSPYARKKNGEKIALSPFHHAYHFDQARLGKFLAKKADRIEHLLAEVRDVVRCPTNGDIQCLKLDNREDFYADFFVDCSGFRKVLVSHLDDGWHSYADILPLNKAMPFWRDHKPKADIPPYTVAKAMKSGWMWGIPTADRMGCGYVFSDAHLTPEEAKVEVEQELNEEIEVRNVISIDPGRLESAWTNNCVALGLAQSFLEPLEATSIHGTIVQVILLCQSLSKNLFDGSMEDDRKRYNLTVSNQVDDFANFINVHYAGGRDDSEFWRDMSGEGIAPKVRDRLARWKEDPVVREHFPIFPAQLPHVEEQLHIPVLDGLGLLPAQIYKSFLKDVPSVRASARKTLESLTSEYKAACRRAIGHQTYLTQLHE